MGHSSAGSGSAGFAAADPSADWPGECYNVEPSVVFFLPAFVFSPELESEHA